MSSPLFHTPALKIRPSVTHEPIYIEANPFFYLNARLEVLGKCDDDVFHQLKFVYIITQNRRSAWNQKAGEEGCVSAPQSRHCKSICGWNCSSGPFSLDTYSNKACSAGSESAFLIEEKLGWGLG